MNADIFLSCDATEDDVEHHPGDGERHPRHHEELHEVGVERVERPGAVRDATGVGVDRQRDGVALLRDPLVPDAVPQPEHVAEAGVVVAHAGRGLEPGGRDPEREQRHEAGGGIDGEDGAHRVVQGTRTEGVPALRGQQARARGLRRGPVNQRHRSRSGRPRRGPHPSSRARRRHW